MEPPTSAMCGQCSTDELRSFNVIIGWLAEPVGTTLRHCGLPKKGMASLSRTGPELQARGGYLESWFLLPASYPVRTGGQFCDRHSEAPIDQIPAIFLRDDNIVLLPQVANDLVDRSGLVGGLMLICRFRGFLGKPCAPLGNLLCATHTEPLDLLRGYAELAGKLRIPRSLGEPLKEAVSLILRKKEAGMHRFPICRAGC